MNINKHKLKAVSVVLCMAIIIGSFWSANATEATVSGNVVYVEETGNSAEWTEGESRYEDIEVTYNQASSYRVTIPKTIVLGADKSSSYSIKVEGDIAANEQVCVVPVDGIGDTEVLDFYMHDQTEGSTKDAVPAEINQSKFYWDSSEATASYEETDNHIVAEGLSAGSWKGIFQMEISLRTDTSHIHNYVGTVTKEPTCTEAGEKTYTCDCGDSYTEAIDPKGHNYKDGECTDCGDKDPDHVHSYVESITKEPTCTEEGEKTYTCGCGDSYTEVVPAKGHHYENGECTDCGDKDPDHVHSYTESITKEPTCTEAGEKTYTCVCGDSYTEEIPATGKHNYVDGTCTDCGAVEDPYAVAPVGMHTQWNYTLNEDDNTITLNYFINRAGFSKDVIVYSSYELNGKRYQTKIANHTSDMNDYMFTGKYSGKPVTSVTFGNNIDLSDTTDINRMFFYCTNLISVDFGDNFNTSNVKNMEKMFQYCSKLTKINFGNGFNTSNVTNMNNMFSGCGVLELDLRSFDTGNVTDMSSLFEGCSQLIDIDFGDNFNTSNVKNMEKMFSYDKALIRLNLNGFDTSNVINMNYMFARCSELLELDLSNFDTRSVENMNGLFSNCSKLNKIEFGNNFAINADNVDSMFSYCTSLQSINLSNFNTCKANNMSSMFTQCSSLAEINFGDNFDTSSVTNMKDMFSYCPALTTLDLSGFNTSNVTTMEHMFGSCNNLKTIYVDKNLWKGASGTAINMFYNCGTNTVTYK